MPHFPEPPNSSASRIFLDGWEGVNISTLCLEVNITGINPLPENLDFKTFLHNIFDAAGIQVKQPGEDCQGVLQINGNIEALSATYEVLGTCYSGESIDLALLLTSSSNQASFQEKLVDPPSTLVKFCINQPAEASFKDLQLDWQKKLLQWVNEIWGLPILIPVLQDKDLRGYAMEILDLSAPMPELTTFILSWLSNPQDVDVFSISLNYIDLWKLKEAAPYLHAYVHHPEGWISRVAARILASMGELNEIDLPPLIEQMKSGENSPAYEYILASPSLPHEVVIQALAEALETASIPGQERIATLLASFGEPALPYTLPLLEKERLARRVVEGWSTRDYHLIAPLLKFAGETNYDEVRQLVFDALAEISKKYLQFEDLDEWQTWWSDMQVQMNSLKPAGYSQALESEELVIRQYTLDKIAEAGPPAIDALPALLDLWEANNLAKQNNYAVVIALAALGPDAMNAFGKNIWSSTHFVPASAYDALSDLGPDALSVVPFLIVRLSDHPYHDWIQIVDTLYHITGENFGGNAAAWQAWWDEKDK